MALILLLYPRFKHMKRAREPTSVIGVNLWADLLVDDTHIEVRNRLDDASLLMLSLTCKAETYNLKQTKRKVYMWSALLRSIEINSFPVFHYLVDYCVPDQYRGLMNTDTGHYAFHLIDVLAETLDTSTLSNLAVGTIIMRRAIDKAIGISGNMTWFHNRLFTLASSVLRSFDDFHHEKWIWNGICAGNHFNLLESRSRTGYLMKEIVACNETEIVDAIIRYGRLPWLKWFFEFHRIDQHLNTHSSRSFTLLDVEPLAIYRKCIESALREVQLDILKYLYSMSPKVTYIIPLNTTAEVVRPKRLYNLEPKLLGVVNSYPHKSTADKIAMFEYIFANTTISNFSFRTVTGQTPHITELRSLTGHLLNGVLWNGDVELANYMISKGLLLNHAFNVSTRGIITRDHVPLLEWLLSKQTEFASILSHEEGLDKVLFFTAMDQNAFSILAWFFDNRPEVHSKLIDPVISGGWLAPIVFLRNPNKIINQVQQVIDDHVFIMTTTRNLNKNVNVMEWYFKRYPKLAERMIREYDMWIYAARIEDFALLDWLYSRRDQIPFGNRKFYEIDPNKHPLRSEFTHTDLPGKYNFIPLSAAQWFIRHKFNYNLNEVTMLYPELHPVDFA